MRLTLRALLAYIDGVLDDQESQQVAAMLAQSEPARGLVERIKQVTAHPDRPAPPVTGPNAKKHDPNRVSEYLDRVLPADKVEEFEKFILHSPVELAEISGVHHSLKLILGGPPDWLPSDRERLYGLTAESKPDQQAGVAPTPAFESAPSSETGVTIMGGGKLDPDAAEKSAAEVLGISAQEQLQPSEPALAQTDGQGSATSPREKPEIPTWLQDSGSPSVLRYWPVVAVLAVVITLAFGVWFNSGPSGQPQIAENQDQNKPTEEQGSQEQGADERSTPNGAPNGTPNAGDSQQQATTQPGPQGTTPPQGTVPPNGVTTSPNGTTTPPAAGGTPVTAGQGDSQTSAGDTQSTTETQTPSRDPMPLIPLTTGSSDRQKPPVQAPRSVQVGDYVSPDSVLLHPAEARPSQPGNGETIWQRLAPRAVLFNADRLVALDSFRPELKLLGDVGVEMLGGTIAELMAPQEDTTGTEVYGLRVIDGRLVLTAMKADAKVRIETLDGEFLLTMPEVGSRVGLEIHPLRPDGNDPVEQPAKKTRGSFYLSRGLATWETKGASLEIPKAPSQGTLTPLVETGAEVPSWVEKSDVAPIYERAANSVASDLQTSDPAVLRLRELNSRPRVETRMLALRSLATVDAFEPVVRALGDNELDRWFYSDDLVNALRAALDRGPETAAQVKSAFQKVHGEGPGELLYRMLWGYTNVQLDRGDAARLVGTLDHPDLTHRVLAFWNLRHITDDQTYRYSVNLQPNERTRAVARWKQALDKNEIRYKTDTP